MIVVMPRAQKNDHAWNPRLYPGTLSNIRNILINSKWKKDNNWPVKITFLCHCHFINWEKSCTCRSSCRSTRVISAFIVCTSRKVTRVYTRLNAKHAKRTLHSLLVYALLAGHKQYLWPASVQSETSLYRKYVWNRFHKCQTEFCSTDY